MSSTYENSTSDKKILAVEGLTIWDWIREKWNSLSTLQKIMLTVTPITISVAALKLKR